MTKRCLRDWIVPRSRIRLLVMLVLLLGIFAWDRWYRRWSPAVRLSTEHYTVLSAASEAETRKVAAAVEALYASYMATFGNLGAPAAEHPKLQLKLYADRKEFRRCNRSVGWAEAFYREPCCHAYYSRSEANPYHWIVHESVHQLTHEVAHLRLPQWIEEGLATYLSTSAYREGSFHPGEIDWQTYPIWWLDDMSLSGDVSRDIADTKVIPSSCIIANRGGPDMDRTFNLYYIHWWSLAHFLLHYHDGVYRQSFNKVIQEGGSLESFEANVGPVETIQAEWYEYLRDIIDRRRSRRGG